MIDGKGLFSSAGPLFIPLSEVSSSWVAYQPIIRSAGRDLLLVGRQSSFACSCLEPVLSPTGLAPRRPTADQIPGPASRTCPPRSLGLRARRKGVEGEGGAESGRRGVDELRGGGLGGELHLSTKP